MKDTYIVIENYLMSRNYLIQDFILIIFALQLLFHVFVMVEHGLLLGGYSKWSSFILNFALNSCCFFCHFVEFRMIITVGIFFEFNLTRQHNRYLFPYLCSTMNNSAPFHLRYDLPTIVLVQYKIWIPTHFILVAVVPLRHRMFLSNFVGVLWTCYLTHASNTGTQDEDISI